MNNKLVDNKEPVMLADKMSVSAEAYRTLRTNIEFSYIDKKLKIITITSSKPGEGKSKVAANLAISFAEKGKKTLLLDSDFRRPKVHKSFKLSNQSGFVNIVTGSLAREEAIQQNIVPNLDILTSGLIPSNTSELIGSVENIALFETLKEMYDIIVVDSAPLLAVTDAQILSTLSDGTIIVVKYEDTKKDELEKAKDLLEKVNGNILGVVLFDTPNDKDLFYNYNYDKEKIKRKK